MQQKQLTQENHQQDTKQEPKAQGLFAKMKSSASNGIGWLAIVVLFGGVIGASIASGGAGPIIGLAIFIGIGSVAAYIKNGGLGQIWNGIKTGWNQFKGFFVSKEKGQEINNTKEAPQSNKIENISNGLVQNTDIKPQNIKQVKENIDNATTQTESNFNNYIQPYGTHNTQQNQHHTLPLQYNQNLEGNRINFNSSIYDPSNQQNRTQHFNPSGLYAMNNEPEEFIQNSQFNNLYQNPDLDEFESQYNSNDINQNKPIQNFEEPKRKAGIQK